MIIKKSSDADTRTATKKVSKDILLDNSRQHITDVIAAMYWMAKQLLDISLRHDWSKIENINEFYSDFQAMQGGFQGDFKQMHWYKDIHLQERHHLKEYCPEDVNLFDVLERIADGVTAGMARSGSVYSDELDAEILQRAYKNTVNLLMNEIKVTND